MAQQSYIKSPEYQYWMQQMLQQGSQPNQAGALGGLSQGLGMALSAYMAKGAKKEADKKDADYTSALGQLLGDMGPAQPDGPLNEIAPVTPRQTGQDGAEYSPGAVTRPYTTQEAFGRIKNPELIEALAPGMFKSKMDTEAAEVQARAAAQAKLQEPYTLGEGQQRFVGGQNIASGPAPELRAPTTRQVRRGRNIVTEEFDTSTGQWNEVGVGEVDKPITISNTPGQGKTQEERYIDLLLNGDPASPQYAAVYAQMATPRTSFDQAGRPVMVRPDMSPFRPPAQGGGAPQPGQAPGQPTVEVGDPTKAVTTERAVAGGNIEQAQADIALAKEKLFPGGKFDRGLAATGAASIPFMGSGVPLTEGREVRQSIRRAVEILLRLRTGAAAPDSEVDNYTQMFAPSPLDNESAAATKMQRLEEFFANVKAFMGGGGGQAAPAPAAQSAKVLDWNDL